VPCTDLDASIRFLAGQLRFKGIDRNTWLTFFGPNGMSLKFVTQFARAVKTVLTQERLATMGNADASEAPRRFIQSGSYWEELAGYSRAVVDGDWIFVSDTIGQNFATGEFPPSAESQCELALDTVAAALVEAQSDLAAW